MPCVRLVPSSLEPFALAERMRDPGTGKTRPNMSLLRRQPSRCSGLRLGFTFRVHHSAIALNREEIDNRSTQKTRADGHRVGDVPQALRLRRTASGFGA